ncbi:MAG: hypothetical protein A2W85_11960 [Bacteroidetes bacterium GWF2_41_31]|nr:MAG: hypothetical protein A2W85_11960 [Bacteroidetes bacterium GWF2_41_31]
MNHVNQSLVDLLMEEHSGQRSELIAMLAFENPEICEELVRLTFSDEDPLSRRAAWPLRKLYDHHPEKIIPYIDYFMFQLRDIKSESVLRTILSILSRCTIPEEHQGTMLEFCEAKILNANTSIASVANCIDIYYAIASGEPDLLRELVLMFEILRPTASAGIKSKMGIIHRKINKLSIRKQY